LVSNIKVCRYNLRAALTLLFPEVLASDAAATAAAAVAAAAGKDAAAGGGGDANGDGGGDGSDGAAARVAGAVVARVAAATAAAAGVEAAAGAATPEEAAASPTSGDVGGGGAAAAAGDGGGGGDGGGDGGGEYVNLALLPGEWAPELGAAAVFHGLKTSLPGRAVQVDPIKPTLKAPQSERLILQYDEPPANFAFTFNLRRYSQGTPTSGLRPR
jgi:hypothetical protein